MHTPAEKTPVSLPRRKPIKGLLECNSNKSRYLVDKHEREARSAEADWASSSGYTSTPRLAQSITPARPASFYASGSRANRLAGRIERKLSDFFNADLTEVRIHSDATAAKVARNQGVRAFTAGADIYFGEGEYQPDTHAGQSLLVHELTHVLQQTGRISHSGRLRTTRVSGAAPIQADALFDELVAAYRAEASLEVPNPVEPTSKQQRENGLDVAISIVRDITGPDEVLNASVGSNQKALDLEQAILGGENEQAQSISERLDLSPWVVRGFIYDCLKMLGRYAGAAKMLDDAPDDRSYLRYPKNRSPELQQFHIYLSSNENYGESWLYDAMVSQANKENSVWPYNLEQNVWSYLIRPAMRAKHSSDYQALKTAYIERFVNPGFGPNERGYLGLSLLVRLDNQTYGYMHDLDENGHLDELAPTRRKEESARRLKTVGKELLESPARSQRRLGRSIKRIASAARKYWREVARLELASVGGEGIADLAAEPPNDIEILTRFIELVSAKGIELLSGTEQDPVWGIEEYGALVDSFYDSIQVFLGDGSNRQSQTDTFEHYLEWSNSQFRVEHIRNEQQLAQRIERARWYGWGIRWVERISKRLREYNLADDQDFLDNHGQRDVRLYHRYVMARMLWNFGLITRNQALVTLASDVQNGRDFNQSYLILSGDWSEDESAELEQMNDDFRNSPLHGYGIPTQNLVVIYRLLQSRVFVDALESNLHQGESNLDNGQQSFVSRASEVSDAFALPTRWTNSEYQFVWYYPDGSERPDFETQDLITHHPSFNALNQQHEATGGEVIIPWGVRNDVVVWKLPPLAPVIRYLRSITELNNLVVELKNLNVGVSHRQWFEAFVSLIEEGSLDEGGQSAALRLRRRRLLRILRAGLNRDVREVTQRQRTLLRRVTTHRRRVMVEQIKPVLQAYIDGDIHDYSKPNDVLRAIESFIFFVQPSDTDVPAQQAALMLGIAEKLKNMFIQETWLGTIRLERYDLITGFYNLVESALELSDSMIGQAEIHRILFIPENVAGEEPYQFQQMSGFEYEDYDALIAQRSHLVEIKRSLDTVIQSQQQRFGFESNDGNNVKSLSFATEFPQGQPLEIQGHTYRISDIQRPFRYHPPYGDISAPMVVSLSGQAFDEGELILKYAVDAGGFIEVRNDADGHESLKRLDEIIGLAGFVASLENLESAIMQATELGLDILELVPGIGQGVMAARALLAITVFVAQDLPRIKEELFENPREILEAITEYLSADLAQFVDILLFKDFPFESRLMGPETEDDQPRRRRQRGQAARLQRLFDFVADMAEDGMRAFVRLRGSVRRSFVQAQAGVNSRPNLLRLVEALPFLIEIGSQAIDMAEAFEGASVSDMRDKLKEQLETVLNGMAEVEIPSVILPIELAAGVILNYALSRLPGRKGQVVALLLEATGAVDAAADLIKDALEGTAGDPNVYWRDHIRDALQPKLREAQTQLFEEVSDVVRIATNEKIVLQNPTLRAANVTHDTQNPDAEPLDTTFEPSLQNETLNSSDGELLDVSFTGGAPLSRRQSLKLLKQFGHDFSHVRVHQDSESDELTNGVGANALTSGSHVFFSKRINIDSERGQTILRHELAHVLQQGGPRPVGKQFSNTPVMGRQGGGLKYDRLREDAADKMADSAKQRNIDDDPLPVYLAGGDGWMPDLTQVATTLIESLTDDQIADDQADAFEQPVPRSVTRKRTFLSSVDDARTIWRAIKTKLDRGGTDVEYRAPLNHAQSEINTYMKGGINTQVNRHLSGIVLNSIRTRGNGRIELKHNTFANNLETYIFARTGLVLTIDLDAGRPDKIKFRYLHLPNLRGGTPLWNKMVDNTTPHLGSRASHFEGRGWHRLRDFLSLRSHSANVWHRGTSDLEFRLSNQLTIEFGDFIQNLGEIKNKLGNWEDYQQTSVTHSANMGLRVGTHSEITSRHSASGFGGARESHHLPQYLLVEYFRNNASTDLFSSSEERLPGFFPANNTENLDHFNLTGSAPGSATINFRTLDTSNSDNSRGMGLPAISLAAITHQKGRLHINAGGNWNETLESGGSDTGTSSQSRRLDSFFVSKLKQQPGFSGSKSDMVDQAATMSSADARGNVYRAMKQTYTMMYTYMESALRRALPDREIPYYKEVAMAKLGVEDESGITSEYQPVQASSVINGVLAAVDNKNNSVMSEWK